MTDDAELLAQVRQVPLFRHCRARDLKAILKTAKERRYDAGETILQEGQDGVAFYLVLDGELEVRKGDRTVSTLGAGDHFGELALLSHQPEKRTATVVATTGTRCLLLTVWDFRGLLENNASMAIQILEAVADRVRASATREI